MMDDLYGYSKKLLELDKFICMLGGEHSVSAPIIKAHNEKYENLSVLQIDAHDDLRDEYGGTPHSHASIMACCKGSADPVGPGRRSFDLGRRGTLAQR